MIVFVFNISLAKYWNVTISSTCLFKAWIFLNKYMRRENSKSLVWCNVTTVLFRVKSSGYDAPPCKRFCSWCFYCIKAFLKTEWSFSLWVLQKDRIPKGGHKQRILVWKTGSHPGSLANRGSQNGIRSRNIGKGFYPDSEGLINLSIIL